MNVTNQGDLGIFSILDLKKQLNSKCTKKEDVNGISSLVFANNGGEGVFLNSPSEFSRFSLSALRVVKPNCLISETNLDKIVIETPEAEQPAPGEPANPSESPKEPQLEESQTTGETAAPAESQPTSHQPAASQETGVKETPKNADNQTPSLAKVTEVKSDVKTVQEKKPESGPKTKATKKKEERAIDGISSTVPKTIEEPDCSVKLLETDRDCVVKQ